MGWANTDTPDGPWLDGRDVVTEAMRNLQVERLLKSADTKEKSPQLSLVEGFCSV